MEQAKLFTKLLNKTRQISRSRVMTKLLSCFFFFASRQTNYCTFKTDIKNNIKYASPKKSERDRDSILGGGERTAYGRIIMASSRGDEKRRKFPVS